MHDFVAHVEPVSSVLRVFVNDKNYGDEYLWCCTVRWINVEKVELCGVTEFPNLSFRHAIGKALWDIGVKEVFFVRKFGGKDRAVNIDLVGMAQRENWSKNEDLSS